MSTGACKSAVDKLRSLTYIQCVDSGAYRLGTASLGVSYGWRWTAKTGASRVAELGNLGLNTGHGVIYLRRNGTFRAIGKVTTTSGRGRTVGRWTYVRGTGDYARLSGSGTYTFDIRRNANTYLVLGLSLKGKIQ